MPRRDRRDGRVARTRNVAVQPSHAVRQRQTVHQTVVIGGARGTVLVPGQQRVERHVLLDVLRVAQEEILRLARQHEPAQRFHPLAHEVEAPVDLQRIPLRHFTRAIEDIPGGLQGIAVGLREDPGTGSPPLRGVHPPVCVSDRAQPLALLEDAVGVVPPFTGVGIQHVLRQQFPALGGHHLESFQHEGNFRLAHKIGKG